MLKHSDITTELKVPSTISSESYQLPFEGHRVAGHLLDYPAAGDVLFSPVCWVTGQRLEGDLQTSLSI